MKKNIGILFSISRKMGVFQYGLSIAEGLINYINDFNYTILYFGEESPKEFLKAKSLENVNFISLDGRPNSWTGKIEMLVNILTGNPLFVINKKNKDILKNARIDLLIIPFPLLFGFENKIPYIVSVPDIMYKYYPGFPEYSFRKRITNNLVYGCAIKHSVLNVVDSLYGLEDLRKFFNTPQENIRVIPYIPPGYIYRLKNMSQEIINNSLKKYNLPKKFIFYPAQFWFHKNHLRLIKALKLVKENKATKISLVLVGDPGANNENYKKVVSFIEKAGLKKQVFILGYVLDQEMVALYKKALALVFPTLIGPTSIPPLEAMVLGTPVMCSNLFAMPEQIGGAGLFFNPFNPEDMAEKIYQLWTGDKLREKMIKKGFIRAKKITPDGYTKKWENVIKEALLKQN